MSLEILSWNILSGGFYDYGSLGAIPPRIYGFADVIKELKPDIVSLVDTHRWTEVFTVGEIKQIFEYASAYMVKLEDQRLIVKGHDNGITVLTKNPDAKMSAIWLSTRNAIKTHVAGIDIFSVYFDDVSEDTRIKQTKVLLQLVNPDVPTIITGDLNTFEKQNLNKTVNNLSKLTHRYPEQMKNMEISLNEMKRGEVIQLLNSCRFVDLDKYAILYPRIRTTC